MKMRNHIWAFIQLMMIMMVAVEAQVSMSSDMAKTLRIEEMRKVMRDSDPTGRNHSIKVILAEHDYVSDVASWTLTFTTPDPDNSQVSYVMEVGENMATEQRDLVFEGNFVVAKNVFLTAHNAHEVALAFAFTQLLLKDIDARVAWVGGPYDSESSSLRVDTGSLQEVRVDSTRVCFKQNSPCYYLNTQLQSQFPRCKDITLANGESVKQCDDTISLFQGISERPVLQLLEDSSLEVRAKFAKRPNRVEMVVFDPSDPKVILSPDKYECDLDGSVESREVGLCRQKLHNPKDIQRFFVLVVALDNEDYVVESSLELYNSNPPHSDTGVIVGSVVGGLLGVALIVLIAVCLIKRRQARSHKRRVSKKRSGAYEAAASEPTEP